MLRNGSLQNANNKGADQTAQMRRMSAPSLFTIPRRQVLLLSQPIYDIVQYILN